MKFKVSPGQGYKPNVYPVNGGSYLKSYSDIIFIQVYINGIARSRIDLRKSPKKELRLSHEMLYVGVKQREMAHSHIVSLAIADIHGESVVIQDYLQLFHQAPFGRFMRFRDPIQGYMSATLGTEVGYKTDVLIPRLIKRVTVHFADAVTGIECVDYYNRVFMIGEQSKSCSDYDIYRRELLTGFFVQYSNSINSVQIITNIRRSPLLGVTGGTSRHELTPPRGYELVGLHGNFEGALTSMGITYAPSPNDED